MQTAVKGKRIDTLQAGRGIAALVVLIYHINSAIFAKERYFGQEIHPVLDAGWSGVAFFFVLSGFLMMWLYHDKLGQKQHAIPFIKKRFMRIYPIYWLVLLCIIPSFFIFPEYGKGWKTDPVEIITSALLIPTERNPILGVAWTLRYEVFFYIMFSLYVELPKIMNPVFWIWAIAAVVTALAGEEYFYTNPWIILFLMGIVAASICRKGVRHPVAWVVAGLIVLAGSVYLDVYLMPEKASAAARLAFGLSCFLLLVGLVTLEGAGKIRTGRGLIWLGDISYSLYLVHFPFISAAGAVFVKLDLLDVFGRPLTALLLLLGGVAAGAITHHLVEKRLLALASRSRADQRAGTYA